MKAAKRRVASAHHGPIAGAVDQLIGGQLLEVRFHSQPSATRLDRSDVVVSSSELLWPFGGREPHSTVERAVFRSARSQAASKSAFSIEQQSSDWARDDSLDLVGGHGGDLDVSTHPT